MQPYTKTENTLLRDGVAPINHSIDHSIDESWPTLKQVEYHRRNAEIIRSEAVADAARFTLAFIRSTWRVIRRIPSKLRAPIAKPGATA